MTPEMKEFIVNKALIDKLIEKEEQLELEENLIIYTKTN